MAQAILRQITAENAKASLDRGDAVLIDVREPDEYARERIEGAKLAPLSRFDPAAFASEREKIAVFHCNSGNRTRQAADRLLAAGFAEAYELEGGLWHGSTRACPWSPTAGRRCRSCARCRSRQARWSCSA